VTEIVALQSTRCWLPLTATWIDTQLRHLPEGIATPVACELRAHLDRFPHSPLLCSEDEPGWRRALERLARRLRVRRNASVVERAARQHGAHLLHSHFGDVGWRDAPSAHRLGIPHVVTFYGWEIGHLPRVDPRWRARHREALGAVDLVLCEGPHMAEKVRELGAPADRVRVHHLGIELERFRFEPRTWRPGSPLRVLLASSFTEKKGLPYALKALGAIQDQVELEITIVGDADPDPRNQTEKGRILQVVQEQGLGDRVDLRGYRPHEELRALAYEHHLYVAPSVTAGSGDTEGGAPVAILEMAATGMPVVTTRHCDIPEVLGEDDLAPERDVEALVAQLRGWLAAPERWKERTEGRRRHIERGYDARRQGEALARHYEELVGRVPASGAGGR